MLGRAGRDALNMLLIENEALLELNVLGQNFGEGRTGELAHALSLNGALLRLDLSWNSLSTTDLTQLSKPLASHRSSKSTRRP